MMLAIGERLNGTRKKVAQALEQRDEAAIRREVQKQLEGGATMLMVS